MTTSLWMAAVRESGRYIPLNVSKDKADVIADARMNTRVAVVKAGPGLVQQYLSELHQSALAATREAYGLNGPQANEPYVLGYGVTLKTKRVFFTTEDTDVLGEYELCQYVSMADAKSAAEKYTVRYSGRMDTLWSE